MKGGLDEFVRVRREQGRSWRLVERDLYQATKGRADVSFETLRSWFPELARPAETAEPTGQTDGAVA